MTTEQICYFLETPSDLIIIIPSDTCYLIGKVLEESKLNDGPGDFYSTYVFDEHVSMHWGYGLAENANPNKNQKYVRDFLSNKGVVREDHIKYRYSSMPKGEILASNMSTTDYLTLSKIALEAHILFTDKAKGIIQSVDKSIPDYDFKEIII